MNLRDRCRQQGFTLVEMLIVVVILGILAMVAVPSYRDSITKSRRADARVALHSTAQRLERCFTQFGSYDAADCDIASPAESPEGFYTVTVERTATTYTLTAAPDGVRQKDALCGNLGVDHLGRRMAKDLAPGDADYPDRCW